MKTKYYAICSRSPYLNNNSTKSVKGHNCRKGFHVADRSRKSDQYIVICHSKSQKDVSHTRGEAIYHPATQPHGLTERFQKRILGTMLLLCDVFAQNITSKALVQ